MIDWDFIAQQEGSKLTGYVPNPETSHSGVTIASGVDLGQMSATEIVSAFPPALAVRLKVYAGLHGNVAVAALQTHPLTVSPAEAALLNQYVRRDDVASLTSHYPGFANLGVGPQTILASVTFQYGSPWQRTPHFWAAAKAQNWQAVIAVLRSFGDAYQPRHDREADYLAANLPG